MTSKNLIQVTLEHDTGKEAVMTRVDKKVSDMFIDDENSRWDSYYYHPKFDEIEKLIGKFEIKRLKSLDNFTITTGSGSKRIYTPGGGVRYIQNINIRNTGIDYSIRLIEIKENSEIDRQDTRIKKEDVLFNRSGEGTLGRSIYLALEPSKANISNDVYLIRNSEIEQAYLSTYLMCFYGQMYIDKESHGVSGLTKINTSDISKIKIPIIPQSVQRQVKSRYNSVAEWHDKAMQCREKKDEEGYNKNIKQAENVLKDLISELEQVIRGEKEAINES